MTKEELIQRAKEISKRKREEIIQEIKEVDLHKYLHKLLSEMDTNATVEVTHGADEFGKDLVIISKDKFDEENVTSLVVKVGDIKGTTNKTVDEIKSQIEQSFLHKVKLKNTLKEYQVNKVWVVIAGKFTRQGQERLLREVSNKNVTFKCMDWVLEVFTNNYPEIFFHGDLIDFINIQISEIERKHMFAGKNLKLSDTFIEPIFCGFSNESLYSIDENKTINSNQEKLTFGNLEKNIKLENAVIVGEPGVGKSMTLNKIAIDMFKEASNLIIKGKIHSKIGIPVIKTASNLVKSDNIENEIIKFIPENLRDVLKIDKIIIDGLDEVSPTDKSRIMKEIPVIADKLEVKVIISSRKIDIIKNEIPNFKKYEMLPFEIQQALNFFKKVVNNSKIIEGLEDGLRKVENKIPMTALSMFLLVELAEKNNEIPASAVELYERYTDMVLGRYDEEKGMQMMFEYIVKGRFLNKLAYNEFLDKERIELDKESFIKFAIEYSNEYGINSNEFINELKRAELLVIEDKVRFKHRSFLDYFAGNFIFTQREKIKDVEDLIVKIFFDELWEDTAFYYIGLKREVDIELLEKLFNYDENKTTVKIQKFLIGKILQAAWHSPRSVKKYGIKEAIKYGLKIKNDLIQIKSNSKLTVSKPLVFWDAYLLFLTDFSFKSNFLYEEIKQIFNEMVVNIDNENYYEILLLLFSMEKFCDKRELEIEIKNCLEKIEKSKVLGPRDKATGMYMLHWISKNNEYPKLKNEIAEEIRKFHLKHNEELDNLFVLKKNKGIAAFKKYIERK